MDLGPGDLVVDTEGFDGYFVESDGRLIVTVDARPDDNLCARGFACDLVSRIQNLRKQTDWR